MRTLDSILLLSRVYQSFWKITEVRTTGNLWRSDHVAYILSLAVKHDSLHKELIG